MRCGHSSGAVRKVGSRELQVIDVDATVPNQRSWLPVKLISVFCHASGKGGNASAAV
jgi:hypothetical protein